MNNANQGLNLKVFVPEEITSKNKRLAVGCLALVITQVHGQIFNLKISDESKRMVMQTTITELFDAKFPQLSERQRQKFYAAGCNLFLSESMLGNTQCIEEAF